MKFIGKINFLLFLTIFMGSLGIYASEDASYREGRKIMEEVDFRNRCDDETTHAKMDIIDSKGKIRIRRLTTYAKRDEEGDLMTLIRFMSPKDVKGTGLLTLEHRNREDDQWLYLPILRKNKRIAAGSKKNSFVGTDFTFEDLRPENLSIHKYRLIKEEELDGYPCFVIESMPTKEEEKYSGYKSRVIWVRKDIYMPIKIEYTGKNGKHLKTESRSNFTEVRPGLWRANFILMDNHQKNHKTTLDIQSRDVTGKIANGKFTQVELERGWQ